MWNCPYSNESFPKYAEDIDAGSSASVSEMSAAAKENGVSLVAGSIPESSNGKLYNTCCIFDDQGKLLAKHRKVSTGLFLRPSWSWQMFINIVQTFAVNSAVEVDTAVQVHLFDIDIPGKITFKESETLTQGDSFTVVDTPACRVGIGICYDLRFPELAMVYAQRGVQLIVYPGASSSHCLHTFQLYLGLCKEHDTICDIMTCSLHDLMQRAQCNHYCLTHWCIRSMLVVADNSVP